MIFSKQLSGNADFSRSVIGWAIGNRGILRAHSLYHRKSDNSAELERMYRVKDDIVSLNRNIYFQLLILTRIHSVFISFFLHP